MRINSIVYDSYVNGPGRRNLLYVQGCSIQCKGCFNEHLWDKFGADHRWVDPVDLVDELLVGNPDGVTILGGEPLDQCVYLGALLSGLGNVDGGRPSVILYSGYAYDAVMGSFIGRFIKEGFVDVLVSGPFKKNKVLPRGLSLCGSSNQQISLHTERHTMEELVRPASFEYILEGKSVTLTGLPPTAVINMTHKLFGENTCQQS